MASHFCTGQHGAIFSRLFIEKTTLEDRNRVCYSQGQVCLTSSEMSPAEERQVCSSSIIKSLDSLSSRLLSCARPTTGMGCH